MLKCKCDLIGTSPISYGKPIVTQRPKKENYGDFEERTWRERMHVDKSGCLFIPANSLKNCLIDTAQYIGERIAGQGQRQYTKKFTAGIMVVDNMVLLDGNGKPVKAADVVSEHLFVPSDGNRGGGKRVWKRFPVVPDWRTQAIIWVIDPIITGKKTQEYMVDAGRFIGMLRWRPINGGLYGRWNVENFQTMKEGA